MKNLFLIISVFFIFFMESSYTIYAFDKEDFFLYHIVTNIHKQIKYGVGKKNMFFPKEIIRNKVGNCGDYSILVFCKLLENNYKNIDNVCIETYDRRIHSLIQVRKKSNGKLAILDATLNIYYPNGVGTLVDNPKKSKYHLGTSSFTSYSNVSFWNSVKTITYLPYRDAFILRNIKRIVTRKSVFYNKPNNITALFDYDYKTYAATKSNLVNKINIKVEFKKKNRISSIVIYPYNVKNYPKKIKVKCDGTTIYNKSIFLVRNLIVINFYHHDMCSSLDFVFSDFQGQNRLLLRDMYIYGK